MTAYALPILKCGIKSLLTVTVWMALAEPFCVGQACAATPSTLSSPAAPYVPSLTFDVASVRENKDVDVNGGFTTSGHFVAHTTVLRVINWRIENLISYAYGVDFYQISGIPKWPWPTLFVIEAKGDSASDAKMAKLSQEQERAEQQHMLQALLEDRFKLKTHWDTKEVTVYNLVVAKSGPKLTAEGSMPLSAEELKSFKDGPVPPLYHENNGRGYDFIAHGCSMDQLVETLAEQFGRPVMNKTELPGKYDFVLKYKGRWDRDRDASDLDSMLPMDRALQEELGLKVEPMKGQVKMLVIDHIEKPSPN